MPKICYQECNFRSKTLALIEQCNSIIAEYIADGLRLTLRQLYYQLVSRDVLPNTLKSYNMLGNTVSDGRMAGLIDWNAIEDRTRNLETVNHWSNPDAIVAACANSFRLDKWSTQSIRPEIWIEKEALAGVFEQICTPLDVPYIACRGYMSQSEMWAAAMRFVNYIRAGQQVHIFHFGDHDPSGIDMSRDIEDRIRVFIAKHLGTSRKFELTRVALNMNQVEQYDPPENPAKITDTRFANYEMQFGDKSWELDALNPRTLRGLVRENIAQIRNEATWSEIQQEEVEHRASLQVTSNNWEAIETLIGRRYSAQIVEEVNRQQEKLEAPEDE
jgi:hypothetical protein